MRLLFTFLKIYVIIKKGQKCVEKLFYFLYRVTKKGVLLCNILLNN